MTREENPPVGFENNLIWTWMSLKDASIKIQEFPAGEGDGSLDYPESRFHKFQISDLLSNFGRGMLENPVREFSRN